VATRRRLDQELVRRGLCQSRTEAQQMIDTRRVLVSGTIAERAARLVGPDEPVIISGPPAAFVSRGGDKLNHALDVFGVDVTGLRILDVGASTGGFTDCLLQRGAQQVVALDVGHGQIHPRLASDPRVHNLERTNVKAIDVKLIGGPVDMVVADVSFISLGHVIGPGIAVALPGAHMVMLVKPQFEAGRVEVSRGRGIITDPAIWDRVRGEVAETLIEHGCEVIAWTDSPITGTHGNREFLVHARTPEAS
jgi:23S rRNA (cytidine1920-2'-O)/16S rRNA (cytidine1409-2'-O)-methyltransferase